MAYVCDVYVQSEIAVREPIDPDRIVEVACRFAIDRHDRNGTKIATACQLLLRNLMREAAGLLDHLRRELVRQMMFADDNLDVYAEVVGISRGSR